MVVLFKMSLYMVIVISRMLVCGFRVVIIVIY